MLCRPTIEALVESRFRNTPYRLERYFLSVDFKWTVLSSAVKNSRAAS
jgi:hypothetical protein